MTKRLRLDVLGGEEPGADLPDSGMLVVGSSAERAGLVLTGQGVEDAHAAVGRTKRGGWAIKDLGSQHGTFLNGERIAAARIAAGDVIILGSRRLRAVDPDAPAEAPGPAAPSPAAAHRRPPSTGKAAIPARIGGYRVEKLLGRGGMGQVFLAVQESLNRPVALKALSKKLAADRDFVTRFQSEARAAAALNHPNVVVVHDVGEADGLHFLSMEFMPGGSLEERVAEDGPLPWRRVLDVLHDAACGLEYAEKCGIVHRDIKPANLMLSGSGTAKIADLGLATTIEAESEENQTNGDGRKIFGTPHFISPEQALGEPVDHRSDLYSLGATAYRLLSGHTPFEGDTARDIVRARFEGPPPSLVARVPGLPDALDAIVLRLMARSPDERFASAEALRREVDRLRLMADHGEVHGDASRERSRAPLVGGAVVVVAAAVAGAFLLTGEDPADDSHAAGVAATADTADRSAQDPFDAGFFEAAPVEAVESGADEAALRLQEEEAAAAFQAIPAEVSDAERIDALRAIAERYPGTTTAGRAQAEIEDMIAGIRSDRVAQAQLDRILTQAREDLLAAAAWPPEDGAPHRPGDAIRAVASFPAPEGLADPSQLAGLRTQITTEILVAAGEAVRADLQRADALAEAGDFEALRVFLADLLAVFDLPPVTADEAAELTELRTLGDDVRARYERLEEDEARHLSALADADRRTIALALGPASDFAGELARLDFDATEARLAALAAALETEEGRAAAGRVADDVAEGRAALTLLGEAFRAGEWRRRSIADPRERRGGIREVTGVRPEGLVVEVDGGPELVPWSAFAGRLDLQIQLFKNRLARDYTPGEHASILAMLRSSTVAAAAATLRPRPPEDEEPGWLGPSSAVEAFAPVQEWLADVGRAPSAGKLGRELAAAHLFEEALAARDEESWSHAVIALERLFGEYGDTLLVVLLSDGSGWRTAPVEVSDASEPAGDGAMTGAGDGGDAEGAGQPDAPETGPGGGGRDSER